jgi:SAM-dependent methyltransferase
MFDNLRRWIARAIYPRYQSVYDREGNLRVSGVFHEINGAYYDVVLSLNEDSLFELEKISPPLPDSATKEFLGAIDFICNICGSKNLAAQFAEVSDREVPSCAQCGSGLRMRGVIHALSKELYGDSLPLVEFAPNEAIVGVGLSDWPGYASELAKKFSYTNTFLHKLPQLDITSPSSDWAQRLDFLIASDVFEHVRPPVQDAFENAYHLLKPNGVLIFTVPYAKLGKTKEHFPDLFDYRVIEYKGKKYLYNRTVGGAEQIYENLIYHGGDGLTLEMRVFSESDLVEALNITGFVDIKIHKENKIQYGITHLNDWSLPITARRPPV